MLGMFHIPDFIDRPRFDEPQCGWISLDYKLLDSYFLNKPKCEPFKQSFFSWKPVEEESLGKFKLLFH